MTINGALNQRVIQFYILYERLGQAERANYDTIHINGNDLKVLRNYEDNFDRAILVSLRTHFENLVGIEELIIYAKESQVLWGGERDELSKATLSNEAVGHDFDSYTVTNMKPNSHQIITLSTRIMSADWNDIRDEITPIVPLFAVVSASERFFDTLIPANFMDRAEVTQIIQAYNAEIEGDETID